ncbi:MULTISPECIES: hypothetical protein [unclassified Aureimonas]|uniref:hypothetical protein n=1 Tax=unclassified Aureimonas TaxID=2615206 RepID=UPI0006F9DC24|nr:MULTISPECIES: hypothetical protein [unclassified Aureimonas]KQT65861.1 hypothetical protein ASG62_21455 [Aureimonas sp. Leaf427]KQT78080.1 hypothetical protein ASG54_03415 [Aureimonas sp. Leaf460]
MPIRRHRRFYYPIDWRELSQQIRFVRAKGRCEGCLRPHGQTVVHLGDGRWWDAEALAWRNGKGRVLQALAPLTCETVVQRTKVALATAHLDHDPGNNHPANLKAFCQRCHMLHDKPEHLRQRDLTYKKRRALGDLFSGRYD